MNFVRLKFLTRFFYETFDFLVLQNKILNIFTQGQMYVFGGFTDTRQISVVDGCRLRRLEIDLPVAMDDPLCTTYAEGSAVMTPFFCEGPKFLYKI